ncbi:histidine phosphatase family protein [Alkalicoccus chagannorensis]|uniref:histidine phosphatase family protein n=1 Tax=Alkalicoccus chagannorensis TaxID=427072 RepID=UPI0003F78DAB|nr:histidine phosphatase family protein [Alkalicoccus chagannorensis]
MGTDDTMELTLLRHAVTEANKEKRYVGSTDVPLAEGAALDDAAAVLKKASYDTMLTSDRLRCVQTAALLEKEEAAEVDARLRELDFGEWEMKTYEELQHHAAYRRWLEQPLHHAPPGGEHPQDLLQRTAALLEERGSPGKRVLFVTHGGVIRIMYYLLKAGSSFWDTPAVPRPGSAVRMTLKRQEGSWVCMSLSEVTTQENNPTHWN